MTPPHLLCSRAPLLVVLLLLLVLPGPQAQIAEEEAHELRLDGLMEMFGFDECAVLCLTDGAGVEQCSPHPIVCPDLNAADAEANETLRERPRTGEARNVTVPDKTAAASRNNGLTGCAIGWMATAVLAMHEIE